MHDARISTRHGLQRVRPKAAPQVIVDGAGIVNQNDIDSATMKLDDFDNDVT